MFSPRKGSPTEVQRQAGSVGNLQIPQAGSETSSIVPPASLTASPGQTTREPSPLQGTRTPGASTSVPTGVSRLFSPRDLSPNSATFRMTPLQQPQGRRISSPNAPRSPGTLSPRTHHPPVGVPP